MTARTTELEESKPTDAGRNSLENASLSPKVWAGMTKNLLTRTAGLELIASDGNVVISGNVRSARAVEAIAEVAGTVS